MVVQKQDWIRKASPNGNTLGVKEALQNPFAQVLLYSLVCSQIRYLLVQHGYLSLEGLTSSAEGRGIFLRYVIGELREASLCSCANVVGCRVVCPARQSWLYVQRPICALTSDKIVSNLHFISHNI